MSSALQVPIIYISNSFNYLAGNYSDVHHELAVITLQLPACSRRAGGQALNMAI